MKRKMTKIVGVWFSVIFMVLSLTNISLADSPEKITVICTTSILADYAEEIGKNLVGIVSIVPAGMCPAHYDVKPSDISAVKKASLILSQGIEPWLDNLIKASGNENFKKIIVEGSTIPPKAIEEIQIIKEALSEVDPENASYYEESAQEFINSIERTAKIIKEKAKELQAKRYKVICIKWQEDFTEWVGFEIVATYPPPERISWKRVFELIKMGKELNVTLIVDNLASGTDFGERLASEIGAAHAVLINFPGSVSGTETYLKMVNYNANQLFNALK